MFNISPVSAMVQDNFLLVADSRKKAVYQIDLLAGSAWKIPLPRLNNPIAVVFDPVESKIYWTDVQDKVIKRSNLDGTQEQVIQSLHRGKYLTEIRLYQLFYGYNTQECTDILHRFGLSTFGHNVSLYIRYSYI